MAAAEILIDGASLLADAGLLRTISAVADVVALGEQGEAGKSGQDFSGIRLVVLECATVQGLKNRMRALRRVIPGVPVVFVGRRELTSDAFALGVRDAFPRPVNHELLSERIAALLRQPE